jgi:hypothetical protein
MQQPHPFSLETTVPQALDIHTSSVFLRHKTACVGCYLARFCTLRDVANTYRLSPEVFLSELEQAAMPDPSFPTGAHNENSL